MRSISPKLPVLTVISQFRISSSKVPVVAISVPLSDSSLAVTSGNVKVISNTLFTQTSPNLVQSVKTALSKGVVEINVKTDLSSDAGWELLEEFLASVLEGSDTEVTKPAIVLCMSLFEKQNHCPNSLFSKPPSATQQPGQNYCVAT